MDVLAGRYELGMLLGTGGMARVVQGRDLVLERPVAVKLLRNDIAVDEEDRERFLREARTAAQFNHPNAVAVFDSGDHDGDPWIVMELVDGEDLDQRLRETGALDEPDAIRIADSVLAALEAAHRAGFVHRDVKPANIMLLDDGSVKLADFGIAKSLQHAASTITGTGQIIGTARYLAPEQVSGGEATPAGDVYAMGIVLYEMLAGQAPYTGSDPIAVARAHINEPVPDVAAALPHVSAGTAAVIRRALSKDPSDRFADAGAMRMALLGDPAPQSVGNTRERPTTAVLPTDVLPTDVLPAAVLPTAAGPRAATATRLLLAAAVAAVAIAVVIAGITREPSQVPTDDAARQPPAEAVADPDAADGEAAGAQAEQPPADAARDDGARGGPPADKQPNGKAKGEAKGKGKGKSKDKNRGQAKGKKG